MTDSLPKYQHEEGVSHRVSDAAKAAGGHDRNERRAKIISGQVPEFSNATLKETLNGLLGGGCEAERFKDAANEDPSMLENIFREISRKKEAGGLHDGVLYLLTFLQDVLRVDSSCYDCIEAGLNKGVDLSGLRELVEWKGTDPYLADQAAWLLTSIAGHIPKADNVNDIVGWLMGESVRTELGTLEAITNLMKAEKYRQAVWDYNGVHDKILAISKDGIANAEEGPTTYRRIFGIWMLSFDPKIVDSLSNYDVAGILKLVLSTSRVEKVIRLTLTVLKNLLTHKSQCESIVEANLLDVVQGLEYEKWRDAELYASIHEVAQTISAEITALTSFARYERELATKKLAWGFIHSSKFWQENFKKFESNDFRAIKDLVALLDKDDDAVTVAVACHDLGEFVAFHPTAKKLPIMIKAKERVMRLMTSADGGMREVRREALLCCQKIMLNKWQAVKGPEAAK